MKLNPFLISQRKNHCGPCSLSVCLFMFGIEIDQRKIAQIAGKSHKVFKDGLDDNDLERVSKYYGLSCEHFLVDSKDRICEFVAKIKNHLLYMGPAILLINNFNHWISIVGYLKDKNIFIIHDSKKNKPFYLWKESHLKKMSWNKSKKTDKEKSQYFALLLSPSSQKIQLIVPDILKNILMEYK